VNWSLLYIPVSYHDYGSNLRRGEFMKGRLLKLIKNEDKKNPYTDEQLAEMLNLRRDSITTLRNKMKIPDSRNRRKPYLTKAIEDIVAKDPKISNRRLTLSIREQGFDVSRHLVTITNKDIKKNLDMITPIYTGEVKKHDHTIIHYTKSTSFKRIIGYNGSLKSQIQQARAAILYPPHGLHTLILGPTGVGKNNLAEAMYDYAKEMKSLAYENAPFIIFNCADYAENPQLLLSQLFGHVKGAYTGAIAHKAGLVEKADGGILFLDEVHRLPPEGQELLYFLIDKGIFRRMGETETDRSASVLIIAATTEDIESSLLLTFRRRIPMIIELSTLSVRPLDERYDLIRSFFKKEADRIGVGLKVSHETLRALLLYNCPGNIGQLRSDIQVACARGFLLYIGEQKGYVEVDLGDLPVHVRRGLLKIQNRKPEIENYLKGDLIIRPGQIDGNIESNEDLYILSKEVYQYIEERYKELEFQGLNQEGINRVIGGELEMRFQQLVKQVETSHQTLTKQDLAEIVGHDVVHLAEKVTGIAKKHLGKIDNHLFYCLAIHLGTTLERIQQGKPIVNPQLGKIMKEYKFEYNVAEEMVKHIELLYGCKVPQDETGFIAMYLRTITRSFNVKEGKIGVVVISHGNIAKGMADVANKLLGVKHAVGIEMSLDEKPEFALARTLEAVEKVNEDKGVLLLVDMGSLITFGELITKKTGIPTRTISRTDTVMVLEAVRRAILPDSSLDEIVANVDKDKECIGRFIPTATAGANYKKTILTLCITGEGTAIRMKRLIEKMVPGIQKKIQIIPMGVIGEEDLSTKIKELKEKYLIIAIVGTIDPKENTIPFISMEEILNGTAAEILRDITSLKAPKRQLMGNNVHELDLNEIIYEELMVIGRDYKNKDQAIEDLANLLINKKFVKNEFLSDVYSRELMGSTLIGCKFAIPHGNPGNVLKPAIAIAILDKPLIWYEGIEVEIVFMLALLENSNKIMKSFYKITQNSEFMRRLMLSRSTKEIKDTIMIYTNYCHQI